jgi:hypothetical protein
VASTLAATLAIGCHYDVELEPERRVVADLDLEPAQKVDLLFVIDNSNSMKDAQQSLAAGVGTLRAQLAVDGQAPDLHVAVVSTNVGADPSRANGCDGDGDDGRLLVRRECTGIDGTFLIDEAGAADRVTNYTGTFEDNLGCMLKLGTGGCGFEQPLESMRRALTRPQNAGFLRDDALLAIVFVTDEDDCSASDPTLFSGEPSDPVDSELGPLSSFRCFDFGVVCEPGGREVGARTHCRPAEDSPYLVPIATYVDFLRSLKPDPADVVVSAIAGDVSPVEVVAADIEPDGIADEPLVAHSCESALGVADPPIRLSALIDAFPARGSRASICAGDLASPLSRSARRIRDTLSQRPCVTGDLADAHPGTTGLQPDCLAHAQFSGGGGRTEIPACGRDDSGTCYTLAPSETSCPKTPTHLRVDVHGDLPPGSEHLVLECRPDGPPPGP